ncbi:hypothetical protein PVIIG_05569 [Plasmodium vivax India VII]|uniref:Variable surface protein n=1 Tax=Plasmodium vivax India VII TaxID=1077284 RepID=A0A0J9V8N1_PLAVI|nr:hypothetical protein PVIIG_05569 [Plasmodium vivax India VII]
MIPLRNYKIMKNNAYPKFLENVHDKDITLKIKFIRLLSKDEYQRKLVHARMNERLSDHSAYKRKIYGEEPISMYSQIKGKVSNNFDSYIKDYKRRYKGKKGLSKLDCYFEKKVFDKLLYLEEIIHKIHNDKKRFKKLIFRKYGIGLILFALTPLLGIIIPVVFYEMFYKQKKIPYECYDNVNKKINMPGNPFHDFTVTGDISLDTYESISYSNLFLSSTLVITVIIVFFYIIKKVIKYNKLKEGKGKMSVYEYCRFCKDIFM